MDHGGCGGLKSVPPLLPPPASCAHLWRGVICPRIRQLLEVVLEHVLEPILRVGVGLGTRGSH